MQIKDLIRHLAEAEADAAELFAAESYGLARVRSRDAAWLRDYLAAATLLQREAA